MSKTFVLIHGTWHGGWAWKEVIGHLSAKGHRAHAPTLAGHGPGETRTGVTHDDCVNSVVSYIRQEGLDIAVAVYYRGKLVVDLAGGLFARGSEIKYSRETLQPIFSATKGITALAANMLVDRGQLDLEAPVVDYWPEFAQAGKFWIPVRCLLGA